MSFSGRLTSGKPPFTVPGGIAGERGLQLTDHRRQLGSYPEETGYEQVLVCSIGGSSFRRCSDFGRPNREPSSSVGSLWVERL